MSRRIMIVGTNSGCGKTTITCAIIKALQNKGKEVVSFKCGPDYVDPMFHNQVLKSKCSNLDLFLNDINIVNHLICKKSTKDNISIIEGVMGFYDGLGGVKTETSAYDVSIKTNTPVILVVNGKGMSVSIVAMIKGYLDYKENNIVGIILNNVSAMMYPILKDKIENELSITVLGYLEFDRSISLEHRHLGLLLPNEIANLNEKLDLLATKVSKSIDLAKILELSEVEDNVDNFKYPDVSIDVTIGIPKDEAICFYYDDNINLLEKFGANIIYFSLLHDKKVPRNIDALYMGGGYPELFIEELSSNKEMLTSIRDIAKKIPVFAEGGSFIYLGKSLLVNDNKYYLANVIDIEFEQTDKLQPFGYIVNSINDNSPLIKKGEIINAHEFHYSKSSNLKGALEASKPISKRKWRTGYVNENIFAGYSHYHFYGIIDVIIRFLELAQQYREDKSYD